MKKQSNIQLLKDLVNISTLQRVELRTRGAQAFNIAEGEEYSVIIAYAKQGGRYYFIDREGRRFLASHYDRAEWLAACAWLRSSHEFFAQDGDPISGTGWQLIGYNLAAAVVALVLCINY